jgi:hypothetical protein
MLLLSLNEKIIGEVEGEKLRNPQFNNVVRE